MTIPYDPPRYIGGVLTWSFPADCGKCLSCLRKRKAQWSYRLLEEQKKSLSSYFVTLTYSDSNVPYSDAGYCINKNDHFEFIKKLKFYENARQLKDRTEISIEENFRRKAKTGEYTPDWKNYNHKDRAKLYKLHYYGISEYGDLKDRPHWHYILLNVRDIRNIDLSWGKGKIQVDQCNIQRIEYTLKYMMKSPKEKKKINQQKEVSFMSKGIGLAAVDKDFLKHIRSPEGNKLITDRGHSIGVPRYYRKRFITEAQQKAKQPVLRKLIEESNEKIHKEITRQGGNPYIAEAIANQAKFRILEARKLRQL